MVISGHVTRHVVDFLNYTDFNHSYQIYCLQPLGPHPQKHLLGPYCLFSAAPAFEGGKTSGPTAATVSVQAAILLSTVADFRQLLIRTRNV